jgi:hypothetical protein
MPALPRARACPRESRQVDEKGYRRRLGECAWVGLPLPRKKFGATTTAHQSHVKSVDRNGSCTWCSFGSGSALDCLSQSVLSGWLAALRTPFNDACLLHAARSRLPIPCRPRPQDSRLASTRPISFTMIRSRPVAWRDRRDSGILVIGGQSAGHTVAIPPRARCGRARSRGPALRRRQTSRRNMHGGEQDARARRLRQRKRTEPWHSGSARGPAIVWLRRGFHGGACTHRSAHQDRVGPASSGPSENLGARMMEATTVYSAIICCTLTLATCRAAGCSSTC